MKRSGLLALLIVTGFAAGCYQQTSNRAVPVMFVNDACGANGTQAACAAVAGCEWRAVECPAGATCPAGVCATPDRCAALTDRALCEADAGCAWAGLRAASQTIDLCPAGQSCEAGGYCHARGASGGGCSCVQPIVCPVNADCPPVECDCSNPAPGADASSARTCTCDCPVCAPGATCAPCSCGCGAGAACSGVTASSAPAATCTCACPVCVVGESCARCDCACGSGNVAVSWTKPPPPTPPAAQIPADPCGQHMDSGSCVAQTGCKWFELGIVCVTAPCPTGTCVGAKSVGAGCTCACALCAPDQSCPPCACDCCGQPTGLGPVPVPI